MLHYFLGGFISRFWRESSPRSSSGSDGLAALHHLQPEGEISLPQPGAGSSESHLASSPLPVYVCVCFLLACLCVIVQESRSMQQTMQALQNELDSLRADNIKLYEKIKFLQSYPSKVRHLVVVHSPDLASDGFLGGI